MSDTTKPQHGDMVPCTEHAEKYCRPCEGLAMHSDGEPCGHCTGSGWETPPLARYNAEWQAAQCSDCAESANERWMSDYYGGSGSATVEEQYRAASAAKRELKR